MENKEPQCVGWSPGRLMGLFQMMNEFDLAFVCRNWECMTILRDKIDETVRSDGLAAPVSEPLRLSILAQVDTLIDRGDQFDVAPIIKRVRQIRAAIDIPVPAIVLSRLWGEALSIYCHAFDQHICLCLSEESARYFRAPVADSVTLALPNSANELLEAQKCFALSLHGATVYHCVVSLEPVLKLLAESVALLSDSYKDDIGLDENWATILKRVDSELKRLREFGGKRLHGKEIDRLSELSKTMWGVKSAWRDKIAHPKGTVLPGQAKDILTETEMFLRYVSEHGIKKQEE